MSVSTPPERRSSMRILLFLWVALGFGAYMWQFRDMFEAAFRIFRR